MCTPTYNSGVFLQALEDPLYHEEGKKRKDRMVALCPHRHQGILGAVGHIILTPANQLMVIGLKIWSLSNPGFEPATFRSLTHELTNCTNRAH
jgi:hypothetical protein